MVAQTENKRPKDALASVESSVAFEWLGPCPLTEAEGLDCAGVFVYVAVCVDGCVCVCMCLSLDRSIFRSFGTRLVFAFNPRHEGMKLGA